MYTVYALAFINTFHFLHLTICFYFYVSSLLLAVYNTRIQILICNQHKKIDNIIYGIVPFNI